MYHNKRMIGNLYCDTPSILLNYLMRTISFYIEKSLLIFILAILPCYAIAQISFSNSEDDIKIKKYILTIMMRKLSILLTGLATTILLLTSCLPADVVAKEVKESIEQEIASNPDFDLDNTSLRSLGVSDIQVTDVTLVHEEENKYTGLVTFKVRYWGTDKQEKYPIDVIYDGLNYIWEIHLDEKQ